MKGSRAPSALSSRLRDRTAPQVEGSVTETSFRARGTTAYNLPSSLAADDPRAGSQLSRASSTNTVHQISKNSPAMAQQSTVEHASDSCNLARPLERSHEIIKTSTSQAIRRSATDLGGGDDSSSSSSSDLRPIAPPSRGQVHTRRSRYTKSRPPLAPLSDADEDSQPFLPFSDIKGFTPTQRVEPTTSARNNHETSRPSLSRPAPIILPNQKAPTTQTSQSSSSSTQSQPQRQPQSARSVQNPVSSLSPRQRRITKEGSEGTPSMGSSFSDLDDASVTQSALEEALANEMNRGGVASRMSTISQALRSRYL